MQNPYMRNNVRVGIRFNGRLQGELGVTYDNYERRTISLPVDFTEEQAVELARESLYNRRGESPAYENVTDASIDFI